MSKLDITGLGSVFDFGSKIIDKIFPDPAQRDEAKLQLAKLDDQGELREFELVKESNKNQAEINKVDAASDRFFQYGWRPFIGWICGCGLGYQFLFQPIFTWIGSFNGLPPAPTLELGDLITLLGGMLGLSGLRTLEKTKKVSR